MVNGCSTSQTLTTNGCATLIGTAKFVAGKLPLQFRCYKPAIGVPQHPAMTGHPSDRSSAEIGALRRASQRLLS
jgi:hypothetical protein